MVTLAEPRGGPEAGRALHDRLEWAYYGLAATSGRWFERRTATALFGGFAGLDSSTMNRVALLDAPDAGALDETLAEADLYFSGRGVPWSVQITPFARPSGLPGLLRRRGFRLASELTVMTRSALAEVPPIEPAVEVREVAPDEVALFTRLTVDAFRMPPRFHAALTDVNRAWLEAGGRAYFAIARGEPVGTALLTRHAGVAGVYNVATLRPYRRRGVATAIMLRVLEDYERAGEDVLTLQVARASVAEAFYERLGFVARYQWEIYTKDA